MERASNRLDGRTRRPAVLNVREKGHRLERKVAKDLRGVGHTKAKTSREASKLLDSSKVDIFGVPYYIQCKNGYPKGINYVTLIQSMRKLVDENFEIVDYPLIVIHKKGSKYGETLAILPYEDLLAMIAKIEKLKNKN